MKKLRKVAIITESLLNELVKISEKSKIEECGIFLGCINDSEIQIKRIVNDKLNQFGTKSSTVRQTKNIYSEYQNIIKKDNSIDYIGEWHTHPIGKANPSHYDNLAMNFLLNHPKYSYPNELILGIINSIDHMKVFLYRDGFYKGKQIIIKPI